MNTRYHPWQRGHSRNTRSLICQREDASAEPLESEDWGMQVTVHIRRIIQHPCSGATIEHRRSERTIDGTGGEVDVSLRYPAECLAEVQTALDALGKHWPIHQVTERPVYLMVLPWSGRPCYVHLYDMSEPTLPRDLVLQSSDQPHPLDYHWQETEPPGFSAPDRPATIPPSCRCLRASGVPRRFNHRPDDNV